METKLYFNKSLVACSILMALLSLAAGLLGDRLLYSEKLVPEFELYIVDNDKSIESAMLLSALSSFKNGTMTVVSGTGVNESDARNAVKNGEVAAALIIPDNFFEDIMSGKNSGAHLVLSGQNIAVSELIRLFAESIKEQLSASQAGIYFVLSKAPDGETYVKFMNESNIAFLSIFMGREMTSETVAPFNALSNKDYFMFNFYIFMMFILSCLLIENGCKIKNGDALALLLSKGVGINALFIYKLLSVFVVYAVLNVPILAFMAYNGFFSGIGAHWVFVLFLLLTLIQSAFCTLFIWLFNDIKTAGVSIFLFELIALFFSGGILPLVFLPEALRGFSRLTPNFYISSLFISLKANRLEAVNILFIIVFTMAAISLSYCIAITSARRERVL